MADDRDEPAADPWRWPGQWVREEKFWRDIGARVLAGVVTAAIVYVGALVLGYLHTPEVGEGVMILLAWGAGIVLASAGVGVLLGLRKRTWSRPRAIARAIVGVVLLAVAIALIVAGVTDLVR